MIREEYILIAQVGPKTYAANKFYIFKKIAYTYPESEIKIISIIQLYRSRTPCIWLVTVYQNIVGEATQYIIGTEL